MNLTTWRSLVHRSNRYRSSYLSKSTSIKRSLRTRQSSKAMRESKSSGYYKKATTKPSWARRKRNNEAKPRQLRKKVEKLSSGSERWLKITSTSQMHLMRDRKDLLLLIRSESWWKKQWAFMTRRNLAKTITSTEASITEGVVKKWSMVVVHQSKEDNPKH